MNTEDQRLRFINVTMDLLHNLCDDLYEALVDQDFGAIETTIADIQEVLQDLTQTFQNEI